MTSPMNSSGMTTSTAKTGSSRTGLARRAASCTASEPATLKAISEESTSWYLPSVERHADVDHRVAGLDAVLQRLLDALLDGGDELARDRPARILLTKSKPSPGAGSMSM